jgi:hypothetical protein
MYPEFKILIPSGSALKHDMHEQALVNYYTIVL